MVYSDSDPSKRSDPFGFGFGSPTLVLTVNKCVGSEKVTSGSDFEGDFGSNFLQVFPIKI